MRYALLLCLCFLPDLLFAQGSTMWRPPADAIVRHKIYLDRRGHIYPLRGPRIDSAGFFYSRPYRDEAADLDWYYWRKPAALRQVATEYGASGFMGLQAALVNDYAAELSSQLDDGAALVVLIHGYNSGSRSISRSYTGLKKKIEGVSKTKRYVYLEVFWDGMAYDGAGATRIRARSQLHAAYAGLALRRIIAGIKSPAQTYIFTHGAGAGAGTEIICNVSKFREIYQSKLDVVANTIPTPTGQVVLAMVAPLIPGAGTFDDILQTVPGDKPDLRKIVVGYNTRDRVTRKLVNGGLLAKTAGAALGSGQAELRRSRDTLRVLLPLVRFGAVNFASDDGSASHDFDRYLTFESMDRFIRSAILTRPANDIEEKPKPESPGEVLMRILNVVL